MVVPRAEQILEAAGRTPDPDIDLAGAALALAALDCPGVGTARYQAHLDELAAEAREEGAAVQDAAEAAVVLRRSLCERRGYEGDRETYDDMRNANLMQVIDRRRGLPVALGILYIHAGRAAGWEISGIQFPAHFLLQLDFGGGRAIIDPFNCGAELTAAALRHLAKQVLGEDAELEPEFFRPAGNREVLLRLQNNIRTRAMQSGGLERAAEVLERMLLIAPEYGRLYRDKAVLETGRGNLQAAVEACTRYQALARNDDEREDAARLLQKLKVRLN